MRSITWIPMVVMLLLSNSIPWRAYAVSPSPVPGEREEKESKGIKVKGESVCLFQSGTADVRKTIAILDVLHVYRENGLHDFKEVGMIRVLSFVGEDYLKGEVVEGEIRAGDIAKKGDVASLVVSAGNVCK